MKSSEFLLQGVGDPRLAVHAASPLPTWLWSVDGTRVLWSNALGARLFGAANGAELARKTFGPAEPHRRQLARLAGTLPPNGATRFERLRGFGAPLGSLMTCGCARLEFPDGSHGILVTAMAASGHGMPLAERLRALVEGADVPVAALTHDGLFVAANATARDLLGLRELAEAGLDSACSDAVKGGRAELPIRIGRMVLQRVGSGSEVGLIALIKPGAAPASQPAPANAASAPIQTAAAPTPESAVAAPRSPEQEAHEPSPCVEAVAEEPADEPTPPDLVPAAPLAALPLHRTAASPRQHPLRFVWQMDASGRFVLGSDDFMRLIGSHTAAEFGRPWRDIAAALGVDPDGRVAGAIAARMTFANIALQWPVDGGEHLPVELSGIPVYDGMRNFAGFKGFGVCRDLDGLNRLDALRRFQLFGDIISPQALSADIVADETGPRELPEPPPSAAELVAPPQLSKPIMDEKPPETSPEQPVETAQNVVPFRPPGEPKPTLTPIENSAFNELARQLSERLEREQDKAMEAPPEAPAEPAQLPPEPPRSAPHWMQDSEPPARGTSQRDRALLDLLPTGILIYRLDRLLYANAAFLARVGYSSLHALEEAGGLDALYVESGIPSASSTSEAGTPVTIAAASEGAAEPGAGPTEARLHTIAWDGDSALALICAPQVAAPVEPAAPDVTQAEMPATEPDAAGAAHAEDLAAILDTTAEGVIMFDVNGGIHACNRSAEALFGYDGEELLRLQLADLFAPESQGVVRDYLESIKSEDIASLLDHGREVLGRESKGGIIPLAMTMGRTRPDGANFFAVFRDLSQSRKGDDELKRAERLAERAANAKADMLARISHELRTPLNAIIGFAEVMIGERFGALGNERYAEYLKDIRGAGQRVIGRIDDLLELSRIETGKLDLVFADQNLNDLVERCVAVMQPQANRERIIIRTSLAHALPHVLADARTLRQITMNLISTSIHLASAGGQVIVSTALTDGGEVALRVRDTGHGLSEAEVAAAMEPFRALPPSDQASDSTGFGLSLTRALVEANRARFNIKSAPHTGTLIEVVFSPALARA